MLRKKIMLAIASFLVTITVSAQSADEVIDKYFAAIGGKENWKKVTSLISEGTMLVQGADVTLVSTTVHNVGVRQDISVMGMTGFQIITPTAGWAYLPFHGQTSVQQLPEDAVKQSVDQCDLQGALMDYKSKGHKVEYAGKDEVDGKAMLKLNITHKSGKQETYFIDSENWYLVKVLSKQVVNGLESESVVFFSNYQKLPEGIVIPMAINLPVAPGMSADLVVKKVEVNKPVADSTFKPSL
ncbi:hypothetical protein [Flavihumibacter solisilvae]|uniref:Outer membrane lipoprotein-sorting protein n=1 Tax=Flavihumibacter solisilvae TaxID=1349421 RepID=A0A0C1LIR6_9BACT|nr:hypothetical protein [Flavihumibacter solisilvae]KIC95298.1 hypothetical protein OI18_06725 [Flavihumibacter solisilvae]